MPNVYEGATPTKKNLRGSWIFSARASPPIFPYGRLLKNLMENYLYICIPYGYRVVGRGKVKDVVGIRLDRDLKDFVNAYMKTHHFKKPSVAIKDILTKIQRGDYRESSIPTEQAPKKDPNKPKFCPCETCKYFYEPNVETERELDKQFDEFVRR